MKCPKCNYLGFETGDRCKNCGYDFSLIAQSDTDRPELDLDLRNPRDDTPEVADWVMRTEMEPAQALPEASAPDVTVRRAPAAPPDVSSKARSHTGPRSGSKLPLFTSRSSEASDEPLIKLPVTPRPPLAVRRAPDAPRFRVVSGATRAGEPPPVLEFGETARGASDPSRPTDVPPPTRAPVPARETVSESPEFSSPVVRAGAAAIDHLLLGAIDLTVLYFTLRIASLSMEEWFALPLVPLAIFLCLLKVAYFSAFTAVGGQTIGKMALGIRVVGDDQGPIDPSLALKRTITGAFSTAALGLGLLPALFDPERRAFHDRVAHTRVVAHPAA